MAGDLVSLHHALDDVRDDITDIRGVQATHDKRLSLQEMQTAGIMRMLWIILTAVLTVGVGTFMASRLEPHAPAATSTKAP